MTDPGRPALLREATDRDVPFLVAVIRRSAERYDAVLPGGFATWAEKVESEGIPPLYETRVIVDRGIDAGFVSVVPAESATYLSSLFLLPEHQRRGVGARVLARIETEAHDRGSREVDLLVHDDAGWARPFYTRHGYVPVTSDEGEARALLARFGPVPFVPPES